MTTSPTNFTEASLADQIYSRDDDVESEPIDVSKSHRPLIWNELVELGDFLADKKTQAQPSALNNGLVKPAH